LQIIDPMWFERLLKRNATVGTWVSLLIMFLSGNLFQRSVSFLRFLHGSIIILLRLCSLTWSWAKMV